MIGAQVCNGVGTGGAPVVFGDANKVFFTANTGGADDTPMGYQLRYVNASQTLWIYRYQLTGTETVAGYRSWASTPSSQEQLLY